MNPVKKAVWSKYSAASGLEFGERPAHLNGQTGEKDVSGCLGRHGRLLAFVQPRLHDTDHGRADNLYRDSHNVYEHEHWC